MLEESRKLVAEGIAAARAKRQLQAEALLQDALVLDPENEEALLWLARVAVRSDDRRAALEKLAALNPANEEARQALHAMSHHPQGVAGLRRQIAQARDVQKRGSREQALAAWRAVLDVDPVNEQAVRAVVRLLLPDHAPQAEALLKRATLLNPHNAGLRLLHAETLARANRWDDVRRALDSVDPRGLRTADAFERVGQLYLSAGQMTAAREAFERATALPDHNPMTHFHLARLLDRDGQTARAIEAYRAVVDELWGAAEAGQAEKRLREISPYLPKSVADSWPFILREAAGWVVFIALLAALDNGVQALPMSASGAAAILASLVGGVCWALGGTSAHTIHLFGPRAINDRGRGALRWAAGALLVVAGALGLLNSWRGAAAFVFGV